MYCQNCGKQISESARFCEHCGVEIYMANKEKIIMESSINKNLNRSEELISCTCPSCGYKGYMGFIKYKFSPVIKYLTMISLGVISWVCSRNLYLPWYAGYLIGIGIGVVVEMLFSRTKYVRCPKCGKDLILHSYAEVVTNINYIPSGVISQPRVRKKFWTEKKKKILSIVGVILLVLLLESPKIYKVIDAMNDKRKDNQVANIDGNKEIDRVEIRFMLNYGESNQKKVLDNSNIIDASPNATSDGVRREYTVKIRFDDVGSKIFEQLTRENIGKTLYILCDGEVILSPIITSVVSNGEVLITGIESYEEAVALADALKP